MGKFMDAPHYSQSPPQQTEDDSHSLEVSIKGIPLTKICAAPTPDSELDRAYGDLPVQPRPVGLKESRERPSAWNNSYPVFNLADMAAARGSTRKGDSEEENRRRPLIVKMQQHGGRRRLDLRSDWREKLADMRRLFPNFNELFSYLDGSFALADLAGTAPSLAPLLLDGPPGVGKSMVAQHFAELLLSGFHKVNMAAEQTSASLVGSADYWANSKPGAVIQMLAEGNTANPVFVLDEIDKVSARENDPLTAILDFLEPLTARQSRDQSLPFIPFDASKVVWICTSNDASVLPDPLLSRLRVFSIPHLTQEQALRVVVRVFKAVRAEVPGVPQDMRITEAVIRTLAKVSPRIAKRGIEEAIGRAVLAGRRRLLIEDLPPLSKSVVRSIGFTT
jgi:ATP-dependent Lon protease